MTLEGWSEFNVAIAGAAAALAGLLIVALSVNVGKIIAAATLPARAGAAIAALVVAVLASGIALIPGQPVWLLGLELAVPVGLCVVLAGVAVRRILGEKSGAGARAGKLVTVTIAPAAFLVGTVLLILEHPAGFGVVAAGSLVAIGAAVLFSWVALVEVLR